jgi:ABC-2 type transport system ATP-binding protein
LVCDHVAIIKQGNLLANAPVRELLDQGQKILIKVDDYTRAAEVLTALPWIKSVERQNDYLAVDAGKEQPWLVNKALAEQQIYASEITRSNMSLESVFLQLTGGEHHD